MRIPKDDFSEIEGKYQEEIQALIDDLSEEDLSMEKNINNVIEIIEESNSEILIEYLSISIMFSDIVSEISDEDQVGLPPRLIEYLLGLISVHGGSGKREPSFREFGSAVQDLVDAIIYSKIREIEDDSTEEEGFQNLVELNALDRELSTGRFMFSRQYEIGARKAYSRYNSVLKQEFGFTIEEALKCSQYIRNHNSIRWKWLCDQANLQPRDLVSDHGNSVDKMAKQLESGDFTKRSESNKFLQDADHIDEFHNSMEDNLDLLWLPKTSLYYHLPDSISKEIFDSFLNRMVLKIGEGNQYAIESFRYPFDFNPIHKRPLLKKDEKIILPRQRTLMWALVETFYYDLIDMDEGKFGDSFGDYIEKWTVDEFSKVFKRENVFLEPHCGYDLNEEATDVLITYNDTLFIVECKTGKLPLETRRGNFGSIEEVMKKKLEKGDEENQTATTINEIESGRLLEVVADGETIPLDEYSSYQPLIIVGEPYDMFATSFASDILETQSHIPYITDIYSLQVIAEALRSPELFKKYIKERRQMLESEKQFLVPHEIDFLGLFLYYDNEFPNRIYTTDKKSIFIGDMTKEVCEKIDYKYGP